MPHNTLSMVLGFLAVILGTLNVVGGFVVTDRMLEMFKKKKTTEINGAMETIIHHQIMHSSNYISILEISYILASVLFILGLKN